MRTINTISLSLLLSLSTCSVPAFAKVFPAIWDGSCKTITSKYQHQNPDNPQLEKMKGYIPKDITEGKSDILACFPLAYGMGPK